MTIDADPTDERTAPPPDPSAARAPDHADHALGARRPSTVRPPAAPQPPAARPGADRLAEFDGEREEMWIDVIARMEEVYSDLLRYETDLESKNAELEEAQAFISDVIASISDILIVVDSQGLVLQANPAFVRLTGLAEDALIRSALADRLAPEDRAAAVAIAAGHAGDMELRFLKADGTPTDLMAIACAPRLDHTGRRAGAVVTGRPVGELRRAYEALHRAHLDLQKAQRKLVEQEKMASLGRLVAGVAHELNNPISFVCGNVHTLDRYRKRLAAFFAGLDAGDDPDALKHAHRIDALVADLPSLIDGTLEGATRVSDIVRNLRRLSFSRPGEHQPVDVAKVVRNAAHWASKAKGEPAELTIDAPETATVDGQEGELHQVMVNLVENALDAVRGRKGPAVRIELTETAETVEIAVEDNGPGVPVQNADKIFEPFFTTKTVGEGTGLGLWISYAIASEHGGELTVGPSRAPGPGARFVLKLPKRR